MPKVKKTVYVNKYVTKKIIIIDTNEKKYTIPKLSYPKDSNGRPIIDKKKPWYVYYFFKHPETNTFDWNKPIIIKAGINRKKSIRERKIFAETVIYEMTKLLEDGFCPYQNVDHIDGPREKMTIIQAIDYALDNKKSELKSKSFDDYRQRANAFKTWLHRQNLAFSYPDELTKKHLSSFLNEINKKSSNRNTNNYKSAISSLFTKLIKDGHLEKNHWLDIPFRKTLSRKHKVYTQKQLEELRSYLKKNDPYLYKFMVFMAYTFLRPIEVSRLQIKNIDLENRRIHVRTKGESSSTVIIIDKLLPIIESFQIKKFKKNDYLFTPKNHPGPYKVKNETQRRDYFTKRFNKVKTALDLSLENTVYGLRHTIATDIYNGFIAEGLNERETILKMLPITRHKSEKSLRNYLRSVDAFVPKDYGDRINLDL